MVRISLLSRVGESVRARVSARGRENDRNRHVRDCDHGNVHRRARESVHGLHIRENGCVHDYVRGCDHDHARDRGYERPPGLRDTVG